MLGADQSAEFRVHAVQVNTHVGPVRLMVVLQRSRIGNRTVTAACQSFSPKLLTLLPLLSVKKKTEPPDHIGSLHRTLRRFLHQEQIQLLSVRQAFLTWDTNKDGCLCVNELRDMLTRLGFAQALGGNKVDTILQHVLKMPAASLNYDDFCGFVYGFPELNEACSSSTSKIRGTGNSRVEEDGVQLSDADCVLSLLRAKYETRRVHQVFRNWDIDKSGGVTMAEIESNLRRQGLRIAKPQLMKLFDAYDLNHDGRLLYDEFMRLVYGPVHEQRYSYLAEQRRKRQQERQIDERDPLDFFRSLAAASQQTTHSTDDPGFRATLQRKLQTFSSRLHDAYAAFDNDHSGNLSYRELCHGQLGISLTEREFLHLATRVDTDGNGEISFKEFCDVFGGGDASNRRRSRRGGGEVDGCIEVQQVHESVPQAKDGSQRRRAAGTFNFSHLTRRTKIPTRCGRTSFASTKEIIGGNQDGKSDSAQFTTEAQLYGSGVSSRSAPTATVTLTLGQEEKQRRDAANAKRLQRLRAQMERYETQTKPLQDTYTLAQERRVQTLQRHQEQYHQRIEEQRPRVALSPARKGIQIPRPSSTTPFETH
ncbi:Ca2 /calmodulin-dependent protein kinase, EF-Hand protein superfamily [Phytophthora cinnamomi]|uniref:Ca2 /calmodulin-dependent protein kinase, EF-Hand protein superfamily n=1 Tax=Phytophthora cinnamomi TaxID=4785 RepID=UPI0035599C53|nr:Ca2 /calmodulin-dependent protein kinase, EF-Hand protein superfamily [Phytophthora cinnamomi]